MCHTVDFARRHNYWGLASEQIVENIHSVVNEDLARRFYHVKDQESLYRQLARLQTVRNFYFDTKT